MCHRRKSVRCGGGEVIDGFFRTEEDREVHSVSYWEPEVVLKDGGDVFSGVGVVERPGS